MCARDEAAVAIHVAVAWRVRAAGLPEGGQLRERERFLAEHNDLFIDLKPRYLVLLKKDVARLLLLRGVENAVDVLRHGSSATSTTARIRGKGCLLIWKLHKRVLLACCVRRVLERGGVGVLGH